LCETEASAPALAEIVLTGVCIQLKQVNLPKSRRVIITILNEEPADEVYHLALLSEPALAQDWERPEEDEAWSHLAQLPSL